MRRQTALDWLIPLLAILTLIAGLAGIFWRSPGSPFTFTSLHGEQVQVYGGGLYRLSSLFDAAAYIGTDIVALLIGLPLLAVAFWRYRRGALRGGFLLAGTLAFLLYYSVSKGLDTAYNSFYLVYLALFSSSFFSFILILTAFKLDSLPGRFSERLPVRGLAIYTIVAGLGTAFIWLSDALSAVLAGSIPAALGLHTTVATYTIDVGIIAPTAVLAGISILRRRPIGYLLTGMLNIMLALIGAMVVFQTIVQLRLGVALSPGELVGKVATWIVMGGIAVWLSVRFLRDLKDGD